MTGRTVICAALLLLAGCSEPPPPVDVWVGQHRVRVPLPSDMQRYQNLDGREAFRGDGGLTLQFVSLGAVTPGGFVRELEAARDAWVSGRQQEARSLLREARPPVYLFGGERARDEVFGDVEDGLRAAPTLDRFAAAVAVVSGLPELDLQAAAETHLRSHFLFRPALQEIAHLEEGDLRGRRCLSVDTWNTRTHTGLERYLFVVDDEELLVVHARGDPGRTGSLISDISRQLVFLD
jgi:hypothetical protein